jgi:hypothetical protein
MSEIGVPGNPSSDMPDDEAIRQPPSAQEYGRQVISSLGAPSRRPAIPWKAGVAGTAPDGSRFVVYRRHIRVGGTRAWRTSNPGNLKTGAFARANGAVGRDGQYAIFPDELTGMRALLALLRSSDYGDLLVRGALSTHGSNVDGSTEANARAIQFRLDPNRTLGSLNERELSRLGYAIASTFSARKPTIHKSGISPKPVWAGRVLDQLDAGSSSSGDAGTSSSGDAGTSSSQTNILFDPSSWQLGEWYERQPNGSFSVSPDQNPMAGAPGEFARYNGNDDWSIVGNGAPGSGGPSAPPASAGADAGSTPTSQPPPVYQATITRDDGSQWTEVVYPPGSPLSNVPDNAEVISNTDGTFLVLYNNDGSAWDASGGSGTEGDPGGGDPGGAGNLGGGDPEGGTGDPDGGTDPTP